jgi:hypothetical protein
MDNILSGMEKFELFSWALPGVVLAFPVIIYLYKMLNWISLFLMLTLVVVLGFGVYCIGFILDGEILRPRVEKPILGENLTLQEVAWQRPQILDVQAKGALFFNMGFAFLASSIFMLAWRCPFVLIVPWLIAYSILGVVSLGLYLRWTTKHYPEYLRMAVRDIEK